MQWPKSRKEDGMPGTEPCRNQRAHDTPTQLLSDSSLRLRSRSLALAEREVRHSAVWHQLGRESGELNPVQHTLLELQQSRFGRPARFPLHTAGRRFASSFSLPRRNSLLLVLEGNCRHKGRIRPQAGPKLLPLSTGSLSPCIGLKPTDFSRCGFRWPATRWVGRGAMQGGGTVSKVPWAATVESPIDSRYNPKAIQDREWLPSNHPRDLSAPCPEHPSLLPCPFTAQPVQSLCLLQHLWARAAGLRGWVSPCREFQTQTPQSWTGSGSPRAACRARRGHLLQAKLGLCHSATAPTFAAALPS